MKWVGLIYLMLPLVVCEAAPPSLTYDLAAPPVGEEPTRVYGHGSNGDGSRGVPVCGGYDCDKDGFNDYAFAQFNADPLSRTGAGEVTLVFGDGTIGGAALVDREKNSAIPDSTILRIAGSLAGETTGDEIWMDDITGDGFGDLIIGRQNYSAALPLSTRPGAGALTLIFANDELRNIAAGNDPASLPNPTINYLDLNAIPGNVPYIAFVGPGSYDRLGIWMRTGDVTGDGIADILVSADEEDSPGTGVSNNSGACYVIRGGSHLLNLSNPIVDLSTFGSVSFPNELVGHVARITPPVSGSSKFHLGATLQVADLDGNGRSEVILAAALNRSGAGVRLGGAPAGTGESSRGGSPGSVFIIWDDNFPPSLWREGYAFTTSGVSLDSPGAIALGEFTTITGDSPASSFGEEILGGLDYSGDGAADLFVGDLVADPLGRGNAGEGYVFYNAKNLRGLNFTINALPSNVFMTRIYGPVANAISSDTVLQGDFDNDGIGDLAIGNPHDNPIGRSNGGSIHVLYGQPGGWPQAIDLLPANLPGAETMRIALIIGKEQGDVLCYSAASGDIDGNGVTDLIVNEMAADGFGGTPIGVGNMILLKGDQLLDKPVPPLESSKGRLLDFGVVDSSTATRTLSMTLTNTSGVQVILGDLAITGPAASEYSVSSLCNGVTLEAGATCDVEIAFTPLEKGFRGAALSIPSNTGSTLIGLRGIHEDLSFPDLSTQLEAVTSDVSLSILSDLGYDYRFLASPDLSSWVPLESKEGTGGRLFFTEITNALPAHDRRFYQIEVSQRSVTP